MWGTFESILPRVQKPARYTGGELHSVQKDPGKVAIRYAFAYPDLYDVGMASLGLRILYDVLNRRPDTWCERVFAPWTDMEEQLRKNGIPLMTLESRTPLREMDFLGFTLQYEMSYTNLLNMLDLAGIPLDRRERDDSCPVIMAGGPCAYHPEPLADFIDLFLMGEGEESMGELMDCWLANKTEGGNKEDFLLKAAAMGCCYIPAFYDVTYKDNGTISAILPNRPGVPPVVEKRIIRDFDNVVWPEKPIVPYVEVVHDRVTLEIFRGCTRGCRFCQAGMIYRPNREKSVETLVRNAAEGLEASGYDEISLSSLSTGDYTRLTPLIRRLAEVTKDCHTTISLPSLRIDAYAKEYMESLENDRKAGLTLAPEAGTQRLRDVINKNVTEENLMESAEDAFRSGWDRVKLYFMLGLPTETEEDVLGIADLAGKVVRLYRAVPREQRRRRVRVTVSTANFVPKPFTPFQWCPQDSRENLNHKHTLLKDAMRSTGATYNYHDTMTSRLEALVARGDRRIGGVIRRAWELGCRYDGWGDQFKPALWLRAIDDCGIDVDFYVNRTRTREEVFPWDHIDVGVSKDYLWQEYEKALEGITTPDCRPGCRNCGMLGKYCTGGPICAP
ncbi:MAG: TIGR03960 family B12-binding radical SAM protein [Christensenellales bacterium]|jgi:radical SAM family uncharacterized protein